MSRRAMIAGVGGTFLLAGCSSPASSSAPSPAPKPGTGSARRTIVGNVVYWDQSAGFDVVKHHPDVFDQISPMWYSLDRAGGIVLADDENTQIDSAQIRHLQASGKKVIPTLVNMRNGEWDPDTVISMLHSPTDRSRHVQAIVELLDEQHYDGIDIDYEQLQAGERDVYSSFLRELAQPLHDRGKLLSSGVYAKESEPGPDPHNIAQDYAAIGAVCDQVRVQTFEYHYEDSDPGSIAPLDMVEQSVAFAVTAIPAHKIIFGAMLLGYDWLVDGKGVTVSYERATSLASEYRAEIRHEGSGGSPTFTYTSADESPHEVWFEDAGSTHAKLAMVDKYDLGGVFFWRLGGEDPATWNPSEIAEVR
jgi:spore germination protein